MIVDGKKLAEELKISLKDEVFRMNKNLRLAVIRVGSDAITEKFLTQKRKFGEAVGVDVRVYKLPADISTNQLRKKLSELVHVVENTGIIIQLPLPQRINTQYILDGIVSEKDPDILSSKAWGLFSTGRSKILPPVVGAIKYIFEKNSVTVKGRRALVIGTGRLVGKPVAAWLINEGAAVSVVNEYTENYKLEAANADIIISGVGKAGLISKEMVKDGVVTVDCGTSESGGQLKGDLDPAIADKASLFTPVPGGVGPLTVAMLFKNLVELAKL